MPTMSGLEFQDIFIEKHTDLPIVFLSAHADISMAVEAVRKGASGFVTKPPKTDLLLDEIQKAVALHEDRKKMRKDLMEIEEQLSQLTPAEVETAQLIAKGLSNTEIASLLGLAEVTVVWISEINWTLAMRLRLESYSVGGKRIKRLYHDYKTIKFLAMFSFCRSM